MTHKAKKFLAMTFEGHIQMSDYEAELIRVALHRLGEAFARGAARANRDQDWETAAGLRNDAEVCAALYARFGVKFPLACVLEDGEHAGLEKTGA